MEHDPSSDAYGRVTDPDRYGALHDVAGRLIEELVDRYDVRRHEHAGADFVPDGVQARPLVRPAPTDERSAPLSIAFTAFPGLLVRFGRWHVEAFPVCGCDACDERPEELVDAFHERVEAVVAGRFHETLTGGLRPTRKSTLSGHEWTRSRSEHLTRADVSDLGGPIDLDWQPWPGSSPRDDV